MLKGRTLKSGSGCPDPSRPPSEERGVMHEGKQIEIEERGQDLRIVEGMSNDTAYAVMMCALVA